MGGSWNFPKIVEKYSSELPKRLGRDMEEKYI